MIHWLHPFQGSFWRTKGSIIARIALTGLHWYLPFCVVWIAKWYQEGFRESRKEMQSLNFHYVVSAFCLRLSTYSMLFHDHWLLPIGPEVPKLKYRALLAVLYVFHLSQRLHVHLLGHSSWRILGPLATFYSLVHKILSACIPYL